MTEEELLKELKVMLDFTIENKLYAYASALIDAMKAVTIVKDEMKAVNNAA